MIHHQECVGSVDYVLRRVFKDLDSADYDGLHCVHCLYLIDNSLRIAFCSKILLLASHSLAGEAEF